MIEKTILGHPLGLFVLFFTEMWERFSYYGMRALLVLYMTQHLIESAHSGHPVLGFGFLQAFLESLYGPLATQPLASQIYGLYTGLVYFTPFFGGMIADLFWGQRKAVVVGGLLMAAGHFLMAIESLFLVALSFLIIGNGFFKPNISTQVGRLYPEGDPSRDGAFTIFYMGINLGAFFAPLVCGTLGQVYGWHYGFAAAGIGMLIGLAVYLFGQRYLPESWLKDKTAALDQDQSLTRQDWQTIGGLVILATINILFWAVYEQQGNTLQLFADKNTDWQLGSWQMPSTWFQSLNPLFIFILAPLLDRFSRVLVRYGKDPSTISKMSLGALMLSLSFLVLYFVLKDTLATDKISCGWLVLCTFIYTTGELYLSPIGLSLVSKVSPVKWVSLLMGMWFLSSFFGNYLSGYLGTFYDTLSKDHFFLMLSIIAGVTGLAIMCVKPLLKQVNRSVH